jgi:hypothetical protein
MYFCLCIKWPQCKHILFTLLTFSGHLIIMWRVKTVQICSWGNENVFHETYIIQFQYHFCHYIYSPTWHFLFNVLIFFIPIYCSNCIIFFIPIYFSIMFFGVTILFFINHQQRYVISWQIKQLYYSFIISKILVYIFDIFYLTNPWNSMEKKVVTQNVLQSWYFWQHISMTIFFMERDISMTFCEHKHIIITHCY